MASLNKLADNLISALGKPFDHALRERAKFAIQYYRAMLIRRDFERNGVSRQNIQSFTMPLIKVDAADTDVVEVGCKIKRTKDRVPTPVRLKGGSFRYVGSPNRKNKEWTETDQTELIYTGQNTYTNNVIRYNYINGYIYVYTFGCKVKYVTVEAAFEDPSEVIGLTIASSACFSDDEPYPIGIDMMQTITTNLMRGEFSLNVGNEEVNINPE